MSVCVQAVPSVSVLLLKSQLLSETGAGSVVKRWQPSEGHHPGWWQWERDFYLSCAAWVQRWEGGASRGSPPPAGINTLQCSFTQGMNHFNWDFSDYLCCDWLLSWRGAYEIRAWAFHWTPALRKKHTGPCSAAPDQCVYTIEPITTVSVFCYHYLSVSFTDCVGLKECVCVCFQRTDVFRGTWPMALLLLGIPSTYASTSTSRANRTAVPWACTVTRWCTS